MPALVRIARGDLEMQTSNHLRELLQILYKDEGLPIVPAFCRLLATEAHLVARFKAYKEYPFRLWELTSKFNPDGYINAIDHFLSDNEDNLDAGYTLLLFRECRDMSIAEGILKLTSPKVQSELCTLLETCSATSLDVERKHNRDKRSEGRRLSGVSRASRNTILMRYHTCRLDKLESDRKVNIETNKQKFMNLRALAIKERPDLFMRAAGSLKYVPGRMHEKKSERRSIVHEGDEQALQTYIAANRERLSQEASQIRAQAKAKSEQAAVHFPLTNGEWLEFLEKEDDIFRDLLRTANADRRKIGQRLVPMKAYLTPAPRLGVAAVREQPEWAAVLVGADPGIYTISFGANVEDKIVVFAVTLKSEVWVVRLVVDGHQIAYDLEDLLCEKLLHSSDLTTVIGGRPVQVYKVGVRHVPGGDGAGVTAFEVESTEFMDPSKKKNERPRPNEMMQPKKTRTRRRGRLTTVRSVPRPRTSLARQVGKTRRK